MRQLLYVSAAKGEVGDTDLDTILAASRRNNAAAGVTGMLLHLDQGFLQVLEGPADAVASIYARIAFDTRHKALRVLFDRQVDARLFPEWSMGFDSPIASDASGVFEISRDALKDAVPPERAPDIASMLHAFYVVNARSHAA